MPDIHRKIGFLPGSPVHPPKNMIYSDTGMMKRGVHMQYEQRLRSYWRDVAEQNAAALKTYFEAEALIRWHNTNERFTVDEFIAANCEYPGTWRGKVERVEQCGEALTTVTRVWDETVSFHVTSFFRFHEGKIAALDEYWGEDGPAPQWRLEMNIGTPIRG